MFSWPKTTTTTTNTQISQKKIKETIFTYAKKGDLDNFKKYVENPAHKVEGNLGEIKNQNNQTLIEYVIEDCCNGSILEYLLDKEPTLYPLKNSILLWQAVSVNNATAFAILFKRGFKLADSSIQDMLMHKRMSIISYLFKEKIFQKPPFNLILSKYGEELANLFLLLPISDDKNMLYSMINNQLDNGLYRGNQHFNQLLLAAINSSNLEFAKKLIKAGASASAIALDCNSSIKSPLYLVDKAMEANQYLIAKLLIENGGIYTNKFWFIKAIENQQFELFQAFFENGLYINGTTNELKTPLHYAAQYGNLKTIEYLVNKGASINSKDNLGRSPIVYAFKNKDIEIVNLLIQYGANLTEIDIDGNTLVHLAVAIKSQAIVELLIKHKVNLNIRDKRNNNALYYAVFDHQFEIAKLLISNGINFKNIYIKPLLPLLSYLYQCSKNLSENALSLIELLIKKGANVNEIGLSPNSYSLFDSACKKKDFAFALELIKNGAIYKPYVYDNIQKLLDDSLTVCAAFTVFLLVQGKKDFDLNLDNNLIHKTFCYVMDNKDWQLLNEMIANGFDPWVKNADEKTPVECIDEKLQDDVRYKIKEGFLQGSTVFFRKRNKEVNSNSAKNNPENNNIPAFNVPENGDCTIKFDHS